MTPGAIMLFAAGLGMRMRPLTEDRPKPLIRVGGRALIDYALDHVAALPGLRVVTNTHYLAGQVADHLGGRKIALSHEPLLLETGGGLKAALPLLGEDPVFTMNTDPIWLDDNPLLRLARAWDGRPEALLLLVPASGRPGDFSMDESGRLTRGGPLTYTGAQIIRTPRVRAHPEDRFSLNVIWNRMIADGALYGTMFPGRWMDVGSPAAVGVAEEMIAAR